MSVCEDCDDFVKRRRRCWDCKRLVCGYCLHHEHGPHTKVVDTSGREVLDPPSRRRLGVKGKKP